jgi:DNA polymerase-3 subunit gamma/tau
MENVVLYRKYRPQGFDEIIGQEHIVTTLANSVKAGGIAHAYLFSGPRGSGKTTIARIFAKAINCQSPKNGQPCGSCASCQEITAGNALDLLEIDAASHTGVDDVRQLIEGIQFAPVKSKYKVFIVDECHQLSKSAANALLKTLEEPPAHAIFILATTEADKMIPTIVSRCQRFDFKKLKIPEIIKKLEFILKKEEVKYEPSVLQVIAFNARGSFRDAESLLDKCIAFSGGNLKEQTIKELLGIVDAGQISAFIDLVLKKDAKEAIAHINQLAEQGTDMREFAKTLVFYGRNLLLLKINPALVSADSSGFTAEELATMEKQAAGITETDLRHLLELCITAENQMKYAVIPQLPLELAAVDFSLKGSNSADPPSTVLEADFLLSCSRLTLV